MPSLRVLGVLSGLALLAACAGNSSQPGGMKPQPTGQTLVYECGDFEFVARTLNL